ncbi:MAG: type II secretion system secretin GspD [Deferribacteraceae bacterium]|jgi:general secretion pathway protein D|nr:type II secretion system secretin GspD [Deferribacteraceae bacterium]
MRKMLTLCLLLVLCTAAMAQTEKYDVNFNNITMKEFVTFVSSFTNTNIIYNDSELRGNVSVASQYPMTAKDIMEIFYATLNSNGLYAVQEGGFIRIVPDKDIPAYRDTYSDSVTGEAYITTIIMMKNYNAVALANTLNRARSKHGIVEPMRGVNAVLIKDFGDRIAKMQKICDTMDRYAGEFQLHSITLQSAKASRVEQQLVKMFNELLKNSVTGQLPVIISDDAANVIVFAATGDDYAKIEYMVAQLDVQNNSPSVLPRVYYLKYANAADVEKVINKLIIGGQPSAPAEGGAAPVVRSQISSDNATNSIIAIGDQSVYSNIEGMIAKLDIPRRQVYVEALILETSIEEGSKFGVEWYGSDANDDGFGFVNSGNSGNLNTMMGSVTGANGSDASGALALPGGFAMGLIGNVINFNGMQFPSVSAFMSAAINDSGINIVSNPQILTLDNMEAEVFVGENRPYVTSEKYDSNNNPIQTYDYRDVGIRLKVRPHISGDNMVTLELEQEVNKVSTATFSDSAPVTLNRTTKTTVQLYDRSIMLISGLMKDDSSVSKSGIPFLRRIPILGWLFKSESTSSEKTNLMVFITTYIIDTRDDMDEVMDKRMRGSENFSEDTNGSMESDNSSFIPMQQELEGEYGIGESEEVEEE